jgi:hypothetical protein
VAAAAAATAGASSSAGAGAVQAAETVLVELCDEALLPHLGDVMDVVRELQKGDARLARFWSDYAVSRTCKLRGTARLLHQRQWLSSPEQLNNTYFK